MDKRVRLGRVRIALAYLLALTGAVVMAGGRAPSGSDELEPMDPMLLLGLVVLCALIGGVWPALFSAVLGTTVLDYSFTRPYDDFRVTRQHDIVMLAVFAGVALAAALVVGSAVRRRNRASHARAEAELLTELNHAVLGGSHDVPALLSLVRETFGVTRAELLERESASPDHGDLVADAGDNAVLVVGGRRMDRSERRVLTALADHLGVLRDREDADYQSAAARDLEAQDRARHSLLTAVSHDLGTPLAIVRSAAEMMRIAGGRLSEADRADLLEAIEESAGRLNGMVNDLLDMGRLQTGSVRPQIAEVPLAVVVHAAKDGLPVERISLGVLPAARADAGLLERALANVLANAVRYSDRVEVEGQVQGPRVELRVVDHGPGVPQADWPRLFEPFHRLDSSRNGVGAGLGLAVARGLVEVQGGGVRVEDSLGGGLTVVIDLPGVAS